MTAARQTVAKLRRKTSPAEVRARGFVRRLAVAATGALWQLLGYEDDEGNVETFDEVEVFGGVGFRSRPADGARAEVIVVNVGGENGHPVIVATRDRSLEVELAKDETAIFNGSSVVIIKDDGTIEARTRGGAARALAFKDDVDALADALAAHTHITSCGSGAGTAEPTEDPIPEAEGTSVLRAE